MPVRLSVHSAPCQGIEKAVPWQGAERANNRTGIRQKMQIVQTIECKTGRKKISSCATGRIFISSCSIEPKISNIKFCLSIQRAEWATDRKCNFVIRILHRAEKSLEEIFWLDSNGPNGQPTENAILSSHYCIGPKKPWWNFFGLIATGRTGNRPKMQFLHDIRSSSRKSLHIEVYLFYKRAERATDRKCNFVIKILHRAEKSLEEIFSLDSNGPNGQPTENANLS